MTHNIHTACIFFTPKLQNELRRRSAIGRLQSPFSTAYAGYVQGQGGGPKTRAGKAASSRNAIKHGITASAPVVRQVELPRRLGASSPPGHRRRAQSSRIIAQPGRHNNIHAVCIEKDAKLPNEFNLSSSGPHLAMSVGRCVFCPCVFNLTPMVSKGRIPSAAKAASGRNAITHGLTASAPVMRRVETPRNLGPSSRAGSSPA